MYLPATPAQAAVSSWQQKGMSFYPFNATDFSSDGFRTNVDHYQALGITTITLVVPVYQSNTGSIDVGPGGNTPTDASLISAIEYVHSRGLGVMLKIHLDPRSGEWRANINPGDRNGWYTNYLAMLKKYAQLAQSEHVESYCVGTELIDMASAAINPDNTQRWQNMIAQVRQLYTGKITYDANWGSDTHAGEAKYIQFWSSVDFIGISAYYPLSGDGSIAQNKAAWAGWLSSEIQPIHDQTQKPIVFTEIGYRSVTGAHSEPFNSWQTGSYAPQEQVNDYEALFQFWDAYPYIQGVDFWYAISNPNSGGAGDTDYLVQNKPVEQNIKNWFLAGSTATGTPSAPPAFSITGSSPSSATVGQAITSSALITDTGGAGWGTNVDLEVYTASGSRVAQKIFDSQDFVAGQAKSYGLAWTAAANDTYTFKAGIFDSNWKLYTWNDSVSKTSVGANSGGTGTTTPPSESPASFTALGSANPSHTTSGTSVGLAAQVHDTGGATSGSAVDLEVYSAGGAQVFQKLFTNQAFSSGQTQTYPTTWTSTQSGTYAFKIGVFDSAWKLYVWNDSAAQILVDPAGSTPPGGTGTTTPPSSGGGTPPAAAPLEIWWPADGGSVSGVQPFKARLGDVPLSSYSMYWQVDGGALIQMNDSQTDAPHKEALVDLGSWNWKGNGPYVVTFVAKDANGAVLNQRSISIFVAH
jgi:uncharacterized protein YozE (UPF0346 family)